MNIQKPSYIFIIRVYIYVYVWGCAIIRGLPPDVAAAKQSTNQLKLFRKHIAHNVAAPSVR